MRIGPLAALALAAVILGLLVGLQVAEAYNDPRAVIVATAATLPTETPTATEPVFVPTDTSPLPTVAPEPTGAPTGEAGHPLVIPDTGDPFEWGPRTYHEDGFPKRVWFTKQGRSGELAAELVVLLRGETLEFGAGLYELTGMIQVDETGVWAAFLPSDMTLITSTGFNATTGEWKYRVIFLFNEVSRNG